MMRQIPGVRAGAYLAGYLACLALAFGGAYVFADLAAGPPRAAVIASVTPPASPAPVRPYALALDRTDLAPGTEESVRLQLLGHDGNPLAADPGSPIRLAVVRADLDSYQDVYPQPDGADAWRVPLTLPAPGPYRLLCSMTRPGGGETVDASADLVAAGDYLPVAPAPPAATAATRRFVVTMAGEPHAGREAELVFTVTEDGAPTADLVPVDGASPGALAGFRAADLARARVSPRDAVPEGGAGGPDLHFGVLFPAPGTYRLFLGFQRAGGARAAVVYTVAVPE